MEIGSEAGETLYGKNNGSYFYGGEIYGKGGNDTINGYVSDDKLFGEDGNDVIIGYAGADKVYGGDGNDTLEGGPKGHWGGADSFYQAVDLGDYLDGGPGNDFLHGYWGDDTLVGGTGGDALDGGPESSPDIDEYHTVGQGRPVDTVSYATSREGVTLLFSKADQYGIGGYFVFADAGGKGGDALGDTFARIEKVVTTPYNDLVYGSDPTGRCAFGTIVELGAGNDIFDNNELNAAADVVHGGDDNDRIWTGAGNDTIYGDGGDDQLFGEDGDDEVFGGTGNDYITGGLGADWLNGQWDNDTILGDEGNDVIIGEDGDDEVFSGTGNDYVTGGGGNDWLNGQWDNDTIYGDAGSDIIIGEDGDDEVFGGTGNDYVTGGGGNDWLNGQWDNDTIYGDAGSDIIIGEDGNDTAAFAGFHAEYIITPFGDGHFSVLDNNPSDGDDGTDDLYSVEFAQFQDTTVQLSDVSRDLRMSWWKDADLGVFVHWGLYSVLGGEWDGQQISASTQPTTSEWILRDGQIPECAYEEVAWSFDPVNFDADAWMREAKEAGADYVVITAKHHDGFSMWDSDVTDYDIKNTAWGDRVGDPDPLGDLRAAADKYGMKFGLYYSIWDWHHPSYAGPTDINHDGCADWYPQPDKNAYKEFMYTQLGELVHRYDPDMLWFDGQWDGDWSYEDGQQLHEKVRELSPDVIVNNRFEMVNSGEGVNRELIEGTFPIDANQPPIGDHFVLEQNEALNNLDTLNPVVDYWQATITMNDNWGYSKFDNNWKATDQVANILQTVSAKGGTLLLNVGPTGEGDFPTESLDTLNGLEQMIV